MTMKYRPCLFSDRIYAVHNNRTAIIEFIGDELRWGQKIIIYSLWIFYTWHGTFEIDIQ